MVTYLVPWVEIHGTVSLKDSWTWWRTLGQVDLLWLQLDESLQGRPP